MRKLLYILILLLLPLLSFAQESKQTYSIEIDPTSFAPVQTDNLTGVPIDKIGLDRSQRPCARIKMRINRMTREEISQLSVKAVGGVVEVMRQIVAREGNGFIIELTAKPETRFYLRHPKYGDSNEVMLALEGDKEYRINAELNYLHTIVVSSNVAGADVYIDNEFKGRTGDDFTLTVSDILPGTHKLRVEHSGIKSERSVVINDDSIHFRIYINRVRSKPQYVVFKVYPEGAIVTIDGREIAPYNGENITTLEDGIYTYSVSASDYRSEEGEIVVNGSEVRKNISLRPAFGFLRVSASGVLSGARVYVDGKMLGSTPLSNYRLMSGVYNIRITKEYYKDYEAQIEIKDGETLDYAPHLAPDFANVSLSVDESSKIYVNGVYKGSSSWKGRLLSGSYTFEARKDRHRTTSMKVEISPTPSNQSYELPTPTPILGSLNIDSTPSSAEVYIDGEFVGNTPLAREMLVGNYNISIRREGFDTVNCSIALEEGQNSKLSPKLIPNSASVTVQVEGDYGDYDIYIDDELKGKTEWSGIVGTGTHTFEARKEGYRTSSVTKEITSEKSYHTITLSEPTPIYGTIKVTSRPSNADVYIDGKQIGRTPLMYRALVGRHSISVKKKNYKDVFSSAYVVQDKTKELNLSFAADKIAGFAQIVELSSRVGKGVKPGLYSDLYANIGVHYIAGYRFNDYLYFGAGTGVYVELLSSYEYLSDHKYAQDGPRYLSPGIVAIPMFLYFQVNFTNKLRTPFFALSGGVNFATKQRFVIYQDFPDYQVPGDSYALRYPNINAFINPQVGYSLSNRYGLGVQFALGFQCYGMQTYVRNVGYAATFKMYPACGVDFHIGITF